jgi:hypothetical protein
MKVDIRDVGSALDYEAYLDGKFVDLCQAADEEAGTVLVAEQHWSTGELIEDRDSPYGYRTLELKGKVEIRKAEKKTECGDPSPKVFIKKLEPAISKGVIEHYSFSSFSAITTTAGKLRAEEEPRWLEYRPGTTLADYREDIEFHLFDIGCVAGVDGAPLWGSTVLQDFFFSLPARLGAQFSFELDAHRRVHSFTTHYIPRLYSDKPEAQADEQARGRPFQPEGDSTGH